MSTSQDLLFLTSNYDKAMLETVRGNSASLNETCQPIMVPTNILSQPNIVCVCPRRASGVVEV